MGDKMICGRCGFVTYSNDDFSQHKCKPSPPPPSNPIDPCDKCGYLHATVECPEPSPRTPQIKSPPPESGEAYKRHPLWQNAILGPDGWVSTESSPDERDYWIRALNSAYVDGRKEGFRLAELKRSMCDTAAASHARAEERERIKGIVASVRKTLDWLNQGKTIEPNSFAHADLKLELDAIEGGTP